jgi:beta-lactam-binding protein with PASTA domain
VSTAFQSDAFQGDAFQILAGDAGTVVIVPDVVGLTQAAGTSTLQALLFNVAVVYARSRQPAGTIISQEPVAGSSALEGATVTITVSLGARRIGGRNYIYKGKRYYNMTREDIKVSYKNKKPHKLSTDHWAELQDTMKRLNDLIPESDDDDDIEDILALL